MNDSLARPTSVAIATVTLLASLAVVSAAQPSKDTQRLVDEATIILTPGKCAGVMVGDREHAITAAHCIGSSKNVDIELHDGSQSIATVEILDRQRDVALLVLAEPNQVTPLQVAREMPRLGEALYFGGRRDREGSAQVFAVTRVGRCPSLPEVGDAIFTNLRARKGDSGAPLVNKSLEVVGLVHGGARCNIAAPIIGLGEELGLTKPSNGRDCRWGHC